MDLTFIGLVVIGLSWLVQLASSWAGSRSVQNWFVALYITGTSLLVISSVMGGMIDIAVLNLAVLVLSAFVLIRLSPQDFEHQVKTSVKSIKTKRR